MIDPSPIPRRRALRVGLGLGLGFGLSASADDEPGRSPRWQFLDDGRRKLGVRLDSGAGIAHLSDSPDGRNLLNHFDKGRLVQQSYYGNPDGSKWVDHDWRWNPVQGGDWKGAASEVVEVRSGRSSLYARTIPRNWGGCAPIPEVAMEEWIDLEPTHAHVRFRMTYSGKVAHVENDQEVPAVFVEPDLSTLALYDGAAPWTGGPISRSKPGWPNEARSMAENWAAYVGEDDRGIGVYVPIARRLTCYRYAAGRSSAEGACSYFAPIVRFAIGPGFAFEYDLYLATGSSASIRETFGAIRAARAASRP